MVNVFVLASFLDKVQPIWLSSFTLKFFKVPSPRKSSSQKPKLASQHSSKLLNLKIEDYRTAKPCDNTFIGPVGPIKVFISPKAGKIIKIISPKAK